MKINSIADLIINDNWNLFTLDYFPLKKPSSPRLSDQQMDDIKNKKALKLAEAGEIGRAMKMCSSQNTQFCPNNLETLQKFHDLHPDKSDYSMNDETLNNIRNAVINSSSREALEITTPRLRSLIGKKPSLVSPGIDQLRWEHLRALFGTGKPENPSENLFADLFTTIIVYIMDVKDVPETVYDFIRMNHLIGIKKQSSSNDIDSPIRPVAMGGSIRKICSGIFLSQTFHPHFAYDGNSFNKFHFKDIQYGVDSRGTEKIIHFFEHYAEANPTHDIFFCDAQNAFNSLSRHLGLEEVYKFFPDLIPFLNQIYMKDSYGCYFGLNEGIQKIKSTEGWHQGCILACWLFCMTFQPFLQKLKNDVIGNQGTLKVYIDDTTLGAPTNILFEALRYILAEGIKFGFKLNPAGRLGDTV